jgi:hypothetical protein
MYAPYKLDVSTHLQGSYKKWSVKVFYEYKELSTDGWFKLLTSDWNEQKRKQQRQQQQQSTFFWVEDRFEKVVTLQTRVFQEYFFRSPHFQDTDKMYASNSLKLVAQRWGSGSSSPLIYIVALLKGNSL